MRKEVNLMSETILKIEGLKCMHCKMAVEKALKGLPGVSSAEVDLSKNQAVVMGSAAQGAMSRAVEEAGYKVVG
jgi:copper chaperone